MVDFLKESKTDQLDKSFKDLQKQRLTQMKELEKWDISNNVAGTTKKSLNRRKHNYSNKVKSNRETLSKDLVQGLGELHIYIKGQVVSGMKDAYSKEDKKLKEL